VHAGCQRLLLPPLHGHHLGDGSARRTELHGKVPGFREDLAAVGHDGSDEGIQVLHLHPDVMDAGRGTGEVGFVGVGALVLDQRQVHVPVREVVRDVIALPALAPHGVDVPEAEHLLVEGSLLAGVLHLEGDVLDEVWQFKAPVTPRTPVAGGTGPTLAIHRRC
jgi:hypothetical protein